MLTDRWLRRVEYPFKRNQLALNATDNNFYSVSFYFLFSFEVSVISYVSVCECLASLFSTAEIRSATDPPFIFDDSKSTVFLVDVYRFSCTVVFLMPTETSGL